MYGRTNHECPYYRQGDTDTSKNFVIIPYNHFVHLGAGLSVIMFFFGGGVVSDREKAYTLSRCEQLCGWRCKGGGKRKVTATLSRDLNKRICTCFSPNYPILGNLHSRCSTAKDKFIKLDTNSERSSPLTIRSR